jgi:hypothetical protein
MIDNSHLPPEGSEKLVEEDYAVIVDRTGLECLKIERFVRALRCHVASGLIKKALFFVDLGAVRDEQHGAVGQGNFDSFLNRRLWEP